jgi:trafficking protein particle complex subunit 10
MAPSSLSINTNPAPSSPAKPPAPSSSSQQQQPLLITYHAPETLLHSPFAAHVLDSIRTQFPLSNLHFKPSLPPAVTTLTPPTSYPASAPGNTPGGLGVRTIPTLPVQLVELGKQQAKAQAEANAFIPPQSALDTPFLHLYLLVCDDVDHYRTILKTDIQKWLQTIRTSPGLQTAHQKTRNGGLKNELLAQSGDDKRGDSGAAPAPLLNKDDPAAAAAASALASSAIGGGGTMEEVKPKDPEFLIILISPSDSSVAAEVAASSTSPSASSSSGAGGSGSEAVSPGGATTGKVGRFYSSLQKGSVLDKLRQDFNTPPAPGQTSSANIGAGRKDRIVHLTRLPPLTAPVFGSGGSAGRYGANQQHSVDPTMFADLVNRMKDYILLELEHFVALQGKDLRVAESAKSRLLASAFASVGGGAATNESGAGAAGLGLSAAYSMWDFCAWAAAKDFLARSLEGFNLLAEALIQYKDVDLEIQRSVQGASTDRRGVKYRGLTSFSRFLCLQNDRIPTSRNLAAYQRQTTLPACSTPRASHTGICSSAAIYRSSTAARTSLRARLRF